MVRQRLTLASVTDSLTPPRNSRLSIIALSQKDILHEASTKPLLLHGEEEECEAADEDANNKEKEETDGEDEYEDDYNVEEHAYDVCKG